MGASWRVSSSVPCAKDALTKCYGGDVSRKHSINVLPAPAKPTHTHPTSPPPQTQTHTRTTPISFHLSRRPLLVAPSPHVSSSVACARTCWPSTTGGGGASVSNKVAMSRRHHHTTQIPPPPPHFPSYHSCRLPPTDALLRVSSCARFVKMCLPSATVVMSAVSANYWRSRRRAKSD
jgi:hypothetical protein